MEPTNYWIGAFAISVLVNIILVTVLVDEQGKLRWYRNRLEELKKSGITKLQLTAIIEQMQKQTRVALYYMLLYMRAEKKATEYQAFSRKLFYKAKNNQITHADDPEKLMEEYALPTDHSCAPPRYNLFTRRWWVYSKETSTPFISPFRLSQHEADIESTISRLKQEL